MRWERGAGGKRGGREGFVLQLPEIVDLQVDLF